MMLFWLVIGTIYVLCIWLVLVSIASIFGRREPDVHVQQVYVYNELGGKDDDHKAT